MFRITSVRSASKAIRAANKAAKGASKFQPAKQYSLGRVIKFYGGQCVIENLPLNDKRPVRCFAKAELGLVMFFYYLKLILIIVQMYMSSFLIVHMYRRQVTWCSLSHQHMLKVC